MAYLREKIIPQFFGLSKPILQQIWLIYEGPNGGQKLGGLWGSSKNPESDPQIYETGGTAMINAGEGRGVCSATWVGNDEYGNPYEQESGCSNNLPLDAFRDQRANTICDMCLYKKGLNLEEIIPRSEYIFTVYPKHKWYQRDYEERATNTAKYWNELTDATVRVMERGEKPTARAIAAEAGVSVGVIYKYFKRKPVKLFIRLAEKRIGASRG